MAPVRVLVIDDSALVRQMLTKLLNQDPDIEVVGAAADPYIAREKIKALNPDVLTLDIEMPRMDGITFLRNLMRLRPMPVLMVSSLTEKSAEVTLQALELGAVDFVSKPKVDIAHCLNDYADELRQKVKAAARVSRRAIEKPPLTLPSVAPKFTADAVIKAKVAKKHFKTTDRIVAIGASTGGTEAIKEILMQLPADASPIIVTQHIPAAFSGPFAARLNRNCALTIREARDGDQLLPGHALIAPGDRHVLVSRDGARYICRLNDGPPVNRHRPAVDVMFRSVAQNAGPNAVGVILTGMGADGALGLREMFDAGARTVAQDEKSSVVWGMPGEAVRTGGVEFVLPLSKIAEKIVELTAEKAGSSATRETMGK